MTLLYLFGVLFMNQSLSAETTQGLPLEGTGLVQILNLEADSKMVELRSLDHPSHGNFMVKINNLEKHIKLKRPQQKNLWQRLKKFNISTLCEVLEIQRPGLPTLEKNYRPDENTTLPTDPCS